MICTFLKAMCESSKGYYRFIFIIYLTGPITNSKLTNSNFCKSPTNRRCNKINKMGNSTTISSVLPGTFKQITLHLFQNTSTSQLVEMSQALLPANESLEHYSSWYESRLHTLTSYVRVLGYRAKPSSCCSARKQVVVFTQRIYRFAQIDLSYEECNYVLKEALLAFRELFREFGMFTVTNRMIGVNPKGAAKVWISQNFGQNHLQNDDRVTEQQAVDSIIHVVEEKTKEVSAFKQSKDRTMQGALKFVQNRISRQKFTVHEVFLERSDFEAFRARSTNESRPSLDFSFAAKPQQPDEPSSPSMLKTVVSNKGVVPRSSKQSVQQRSSVEVRNSHQFTKLPHMHPGGQQKIIRGSTQSIQSRGSIGGTKTGGGRLTQHIIHLPRGSSQMKISNNPAAPQKQSLMKPIQPPTPSSTSLKTAETLQRDAVVSVKSLKSQSTLPQTSGGKLPSTEQLKKSDSERMLQIQQMQMMHRIPKIDSIVVISRGDKQQELIDIDNPPVNCRVTLVESTIQKGMCNFSQ